MSSCVPTVSKVQRTCSIQRVTRVSRSSRPQGLTKEFRGFVAVKDVSLKVRAGTIHALIGPNGAGKTTCFNLLTKFLTPPRAGSSSRGRTSPRDKPADIARRGVVRSFQISAVFPHLTVLENMRVALQRKRGSSFDFWRSERALNDLEPQARELAEAVGLQDFTQTLAVELPYGRKRALEIATTLALDPELLLLDEPTAGMGHEDVDRISALIKKVAASRTVLMVEHNLSVVANLSRHHHGAGPGRDPGRGRLRRGLEEQGRGPGVHGVGPCLRQRAAPRDRPGGRRPRAAPRRGPPGLVRRAPHPSRRGLRDSPRRAGDPARPQRRGEDHHAALADGHGAAPRGLGALDGHETIRLPPHRIARLGIALLPGGARHLRQPERGGESAPAARRSAPAA